MSGKQIRKKLTINNALKVGRREHNAEGPSRGQQEGQISNLSILAH